MLILPVIDLMHGQVVRAARGQRDQYRPMCSKLVQSAEPIAVARAYREVFGLSTIYLADLDAILGGQPATSIYTQLKCDGFQVWIDAGIRIASDAQPLLEAGVDRIICGLETLAGPNELARLCQQHDTDRMVFSLDLRDGQPMASADVWPASDPLQLTRTAYEAGVRHTIVLDLARVGTGEGTGTETLCSALIKTFADLKVYVGGGIRTAEQLQKCHDMGCAGVLMASSLHDGSIHRDELDMLAG